MTTEPAEELRLLRARVVELERIQREITLPDDAAAFERARRRAEEAVLAAFAAEQQSRFVADELRAANLALTRTLHLDEVLATLLRHLSRLVPYDSAAVVLASGESRLATRDGLSEMGLRVSVAEDGAALMLSPALAPLVRERESILICDTLAYPDWRAPAGAKGMRSWFGVPLLAGGELIGIYSVSTVEPDSFTLGDLRMAEALASQAAVAIQNARLFAEVGAGRERLQALSHQLVRAQENERRHIARELHDDVAQALGLIKLNMRAVQRLAPSSRLEQSLGLIEATLERVRTLALELRPSILDDLGLVAALRWYADRQAQLAGFAAEVCADGEARLPNEIETVCFRVAQEALNNVARHAHAHAVKIELERDMIELRLTIRDDGDGFDVEHAQARATSGVSMGLLSMQERAALVGGRLVVESQLGTGTIVRAFMPL
jgi:signal transduction histidine kinase